MHYEATEPMIWRSRGRPGAREVRGSGEELFKDGSKTRLRIRRSADHRVDCKKILQNGNNNFSRKDENSGVASSTFVVPSCLPATSDSIHSPSCIVSNSAFSSGLVRTFLLSMRVQAPLWNNRLGDHTHRKVSRHQSCLCRLCQVR